MKKIILIAVSLCMFNCIYAQIPKGSTLLGGDLLFQNYTDKTGSVKSEQNTFSFTPVFAKAIKENLFVGGYIGFGISKASATASDIKNETNAYLIGVLIRKYKPIKNGFYLFGQGDLGYSYTKLESKSASSSALSNTKGNTIGIAISPGISYAVTDRFHIEAALPQLLALSYNNTAINYSYDTNSTVTKRNNISFNSSLSSLSQISLGFRVLLQKKP